MAAGDGVEVHYSRQGRRQNVSRKWLELRGPQGLPTSDLVSSGQFTPPKVP